MKQSKDKVEKQNKYAQQMHEMVMKKRKKMYEKLKKMCENLIKMDKKKRENENETN